MPWSNYISDKGRSFSFRNSHLPRRGKGHGWMSFAGYLLIQKATTSPGPTDANIKKKEGRLRFEGKLPSMAHVCEGRNEAERKLRLLLLSFKNPFYFVLPTKEWHHSFLSSASNKQRISLRRAKENSCVSNAQ